MKTDYNQASLVSAYIQVKGHSKVSISMHAITEESADSISQVFPDLSTGDRGTICIHTLPSSHNPDWSCISWNSSSFRQILHTANNTWYHYMLSDPFRCSYFSLVAFHTFTVNIFDIQCLL